MKNVLEKGIAIGLLAFGIGIVHADISSKHGGYLPSLKPAEPPVATNVRFLAEPRNSSTVVFVKYK